MKRSIKLKNILYFFLLASVLILYSVTGCKKEEELGEAPRLFRPVVSGEIEGASNWITASWLKVKGAVNYTAEISTDTFKTIISSVTTDSNTVTFENLKWLTLYQVQVRANAEDTGKNSGFSFLGTKRTEKFPSIMFTPASSEILDKAVQLKWTNKGDAVTSFKITLASGGTLVKEVPITADDIVNQYKVISGLTPLTTYVATLYSGTTVRGYETFTTTDQIIKGTNIVDLSQETNADVLTSTYLASLTEGAIVILKRGMTYNISGTVNIDKSVTFVSEVTFFGAPAKMNLVGNFNSSAAVNVAEINFKSVYLIGLPDAYGSRYVFNFNTTATIAKITFDDCKIKSIRGVLRTQSGPKIERVSINNCIIDSISNYGVVNCDNASSTINNVEIKNSTISDVQKFLVSKSNLNSVTVENCTFYYAPLGGNYFFDYNTFNVASGIIIKNSIFAAPRPTTATPPVTAAYGIRPATITITSAGNYKTSDLVWTSNGLPDLTDYTGTSTTLFQNPANDDFKLIDSRFAGKATAGDPRWR